MKIFKAYGRMFFLAFEIFSVVLFGAWRFDLINT